MQRHIISQEVIDGFKLLGLPVNETSYSEDPETIIFEYTKNLEDCTLYTANTSKHESYSSVAEALHAKLGQTT